MRDSRLTVLYGIGQLSIGGAERQLYELVSRIDRGKYRPLVFTLSSGGYYAELLAEHEIPVIELVRKRAYDPSPIWKLAQIIRRENVQVLHTFGFYAGLFGRLAAYCKRPILVISSERAVRAWMKHLNNPIYFALDRFLARRTDVFIANAEAVKQFAVRDKGLPADRMVVVYNGIDGVRLHHSAADRQALNEKYGFQPDDRVVGIVARLDPMKDHLAFLQAAQILLGQESGAKFLIVGDGPLRKELEEVVREMGIESAVYFAGAQHGHSLIQHMARIDVFVSSSREGEGCSNSILEAMCMGKAVVVTDVGGNPELVRSGETGIIVPVGNIDAIATEVAMLLADDELRLRLGQQAREHVRLAFSVEHMVAETMKVYAENLPGIKNGAAH